MWNTNFSVYQYLNMIEKAENVLELDWILNDPLTEYCKIYLFIFYELWKFRPMAVRCVVHHRGIKTPGYVWIILIVTRSPPVMEVVHTCSYDQLYCLLSVAEKH